MVVKPEEKPIIKDVKPPIPSPSSNEDLNKVPNVVVPPDLTKSTRVRLPDNLKGKDHNRLNSDSAKNSDGAKLTNPNSTYRVKHNKTVRPGK